MIKPISEDIWTMDGPNIVFLGAPMHTRMTIIRLSNNRLWVHSPIELSEPVHAALRELGGEVAYLIAPNKFHYMYVSQWRSAFPQAKVLVERSLTQKVPELASCEILTNQAPTGYSQDIAQVVFAGNRMFEEAVFFHNASGSLVFTDLMINLKTDKMKFLPRLFLKFEGAAYPNGGVGRLYRWFSKDKDAARQALQIIRSWAPKRILFCHGEPFEVTAGELLNREFKYLG